MVLVRTLLALLGLFLVSARFAHPGGGLDAYLFYGEGCPHCRAERVFLDNCIQKYPGLKVHTYEVYFNDGNMELFQKVAAGVGAGVGGIPFLVIGDEAIVGFDRALTPGRIEGRIGECLAAQCPNRVRRIVLLHEGGSAAERDAAADGTAPAETGRPGAISLPFLGEVDPMSFSLPVLTIVMGLLDGFNPCAMWALLFLISLLLGMGDRTRMWVLGTAFVAASALVYFLFMAAWLKLILFFGLVFWVRIAIGLLAVCSGGWSIREALKQEEIACSLSGDARRRKLRDRLRDAISRHSLALSLGGVVLLAFLVNLIEIVCSAGFPAIYTQVLSLSELPAWKYHAYILLYIAFFMLDDMIVFVVAMLTLQIAGATTKYTRMARLAGGILIFLIGVLLIFRPQWLMFG